MFYVWARFRFLILCEVRIELRVDFKMFKGLPLLNLNYFLLSMILFFLYLFISGFKIDHIFVIDAHATYGWFLLRSLHAQLFIGFLRCKMIRTNFHPLWCLKNQFRLEREIERFFTYRVTRGVLPRFRKVIWSWARKLFYMICLLLTGFIVILCLKISFTVT